MGLVIHKFHGTQINKLEETIQILNDRLAEADVRQERVMKEKNSIIKMKVCNKHNLCMFEVFLVFSLM